MEHALGLESQLMFVRLLLPPRNGFSPPTAMPPCKASLTLPLPHDRCHSLRLEKAWAPYWEDQGWAHIPFLCHNSSTMTCVAGDQLEAESWLMKLLVPPSRSFFVLWHRGLKILGGHPFAMS